MSELNFVRGRYSRNFQILAALADNPKLISLLQISETNIAEGKEGSPSGCAYCEAEYDYFGPECSAWTAEDRKTKISFTRVIDQEAGLQYKWKLRRLGFDPVEYDKKGKRLTSPGSAIVAEVCVSKWDGNRATRTDNRPTPGHNAAPGKLGTGTPRKRAPRTWSYA